jgi:hypothetical protein
VPSKALTSLILEQNLIKQVEEKKIKPKDEFRLNFHHWISTRLISCKLELLILKT